MGRSFSLGETMFVKSKNPGDSMTVNGESYTSDENSLVEIPDEAVGIAASFSFFPVFPQPEASPKGRRKKGDTTDAADSAATAEPGQSEPQPQ